MCRCESGCIANLPNPWYHISMNRFDVISINRNLHESEEDGNNLKKQSGRLKAFCKKAASEAYAIPGFHL
ncbi:hypothetical protein ASD24_15545 [Paenibacillus sp. Root52]|nr:hypothetical protein ASD24_15545 [Paenibacillus sp. Root52]